jgi:hypothetical protein
MIRRVPGAALAIGAFVLTVLLGVGGTAANALWQQSATATMSVTANGTWISVTCTNSPSEKDPKLVVTLTQAASLSYYAVRPNGSNTAVTPQGPAGVAFLVDLDAAGIFANTSAGSMTVYVSALSNGVTVATNSVTLTLESNGKRKCP